LRATAASPRFERGEKIRKNEAIPLHDFAGFDGDLAVEHRARRSEGVELAVFGTGVAGFRQRREQLAVEGPAREAFRHLGGVEANYAGFQTAGNHVVGKFARGPKPKREQRFKTGGGKLALTIGADVSEKKIPEGDRPDAFQDRLPADIAKNALVLLVRTGPGEIDAPQRQVRGARLGFDEFPAHAVHRHAPERGVESSEKAGDFYAWHGAQHVQAPGAVLAAAPTEQDAFHARRPRVILAGMALLEVICQTEEDARQAEDGGAHRIELVRGIARGGFTPSCDVIDAVVRATRLPVRVMIREDTNHDVTNKARIASMAASVRRANELGASGVVLGLRRGRKPDCALTARLLAAGAGLPATFHHAFEELDDPLAAIALLKTIPAIDRILSHGGHLAWEAKAAHLEELRRAALPEITLLAGGGVDESVIRLLRRRTGLCEFHAGRAARGGPDAEAPVSAARVKRLVRAIED
jgi:copper homeostasis protein